MEFLQLDRPIRVPTEVQANEENVWLRYTLLVASEIRYRNSLISQIVRTSDSSHNFNTRPSSQMTFCIDVRSERMRRHVETAGNQIQTFGFAGFFGIPLEVKGADEVSRTRQLPVLLDPSVHAAEQLIGENLNETQAITERAGRGGPGGASGTPSKPRASAALPVSRPRASGEESSFLKVQQA